MMEDQQNTEHVFLYHFYII